MIEEIIKLFDRDLKNLRHEIELYEDQELLWKTDGKINNSAGNLALHLCGNLKHFVGTVLGGTDYIRERDEEFSIKDIPKNELLADIDQTIDMVTTSLISLSKDDLDKTFPVRMWDSEFTTRFFLMHLLGHLNYHLGQVNYHRRLIS